MRGIDKGLMLCLGCHQINKPDPAKEQQYCTRCGTMIFFRRPASMTRTWALLICAAILYIPANLLPIMTVRSLGQDISSTIMQGIIELYNHGMAPIAAVVFIASFLVPTFKIVGLTLLLITLQRHQNLSAQRRLVMYRAISWIGRWSMLDVFVISILVTIVKFGSLATIEADWGAIAFASVVILTMFAALAFDPRLIWDNVHTEVEHE